MTWLEERIGRLEGWLAERRAAAEELRAAGDLVPRELQRAIALMAQDVELLRRVKAWADDQVGWDPGVGRSGRWTEAEHELLAAARREE